MVVIVNRIFSAILFVQVFLYRLISQNSLVLYSFLSLWFNAPVIYCKFLTFVNSEFGRFRIKAPRYYFSRKLSSGFFLYSFVFSLPDFSKKHFLFGNHCLRVIGFDLFKLLFWSTKRYWIKSFRTNFVGFSIFVLLFLEYVVRESG